MRQGPSAPQSRERGAALILVVWAVGLMAVFAASAARDASLDNEEARLLRGGVVAKAIAEGGLRYGTELWQSGDEQAVTGSVLCATAEGLLRLDFAPASSRIDVNLAPESLLESLFIALGADRDTALTAAAYIVDYRDVDDTPSVHGGEAMAYQRAGLRRGPKNAVIENISELAHIPGLPVWLYRDARQHLTTYGAAGTPDEAYTDDIVLAAYAGLSAPLTVRQPGEVESGRIDGRFRRPVSSGGQQRQMMSGPMRVRAAARASTGGYHVIDAEISGQSTRGSTPRILRLDIGAVSEGDFEMADGGDVPPCKAVSEIRQD